VRGYVIPFVVIFLACGAGFLALDVGIMSLQGLSLIFHG
jgi:hypothetical protein